MVIFKCDVCGAEIKEGEENGKLIYVEKTFVFVKHQQQDAVKQTEMLFCSQCLRGIKSYCKGQKNLDKE